MFGKFSQVADNEVHGSAGGFGLCPGCFPAEDKDGEGSAFTRHTHVRIEAVAHHRCIPWLDPPPVKGSGDCKTT